MTAPISSVGTSTTSVSSTSPASNGGSSSGLGSLIQPNTFLTMLVDEIKYQDPLNPTSSSNFMAQLAQLSQVEQLSTVSSSMQVSEAAALIGKSVTGTDANGKAISGTVSAVTNGANGPTLEVNGTFIDLSSVTKIS